MSDNVVLNAGSGGDTIAADDVGGAKYQRIKLSLGADGTVGDAPVGGGVESGVLRVTIASDSTGVLSVDDNGGSLTVDGTVAVSGTVAVTDNSGSLTVDNGGTFAVQATLAAETTKVIGTVNIAAAQTLATVTTVSAVTAISNALPAGTNAIGKLAANSGVDIGDVDVTTVGTVTPGTAATSLGKAEDAAHSSGDVGVFALGVRQDTATQLAGTDGDYSPLITDASGRLHTIASLAASQTLATVTTVATVTNVATIGTSVTPGTSAAHLGKAEDAAHSSGDTGVMGLAVRRDADTTLVGTDGDYAPLQVNAAGSLKVAITAGAGSGGTSIADAAAFTRATTSTTPVAGVVETSAPTLTNGNTGTLSLTTAGAVRVSVASGGIAGVVEDAASSGGEEGVLAMAVRRDTAASSSGTDGDFSTLNTDANGRLHVITGPSTGTIEVVGDVAHDAAAAGNPILAGAYASAAAPSDVSADADAVRLWALRSGALAVQPTMAGVLAVAGNGASGTGVQRVTIANDSTGILATVTNVATIGTSVTPGTAAANLGKAEDAAHTSGDVGVMALSVRQNTAAATSGTDGDYQPLITDTNGRLHTIEASGASILTSVQLIDDPVIADDAAFTPATSKVMMAGFQADESSTDSVDEGDAGAARMTLDRKVIVADYAHAAAGGGSSYSALSTAAVLAAQVKGSAGKVFSLQVFNLNAAARYVRLYDQTGAPASTDGANIVWRGIIPGNTAGAGFVAQFPKGKQFATGIGIRASAAVADNDTTVLAANELTFNVDYA